MKLATLCYIKDNGLTLMMHRIKKADDIHAGKWNGLGGKLEAGESPEQCVIREVREEAGIETDLMAPLEKTQYWFSAEKDGERMRFHKYVHWFLMRYSSGSVEDHDHEVAEARWVQIDKALTMLVFKNEREIVEKARDIMNTL